LVQKPSRFFQGVVSLNRNATLESASIQSRFQVLRKEGASNGLELVAHPGKGFWVGPKVLMGIQSGGARHPSPLVFHSFPSGHEKAATESGFIATPYPGE
jgi:hypothetical protein